MDWRAEAENGKMEESESKIALLLSHFTNLPATCIAQQEDIHSLNDAVQMHNQAFDQVNSRLQQLEQGPVTAPDASSSNTSDRLNALEIDVGALNDGAQLQQTAMQQLEQRICAATANPSPAPRETTPKFDGQEIFCDWTKTDLIPSFRKFELAATPRQRGQASRTFRWGFKAVKHYFITRSCPAFGNALTHVEDTLTTTAELFNKASQIIVTNKETKKLYRSPAKGPSRDRHPPKVVVVAGQRQTTLLARPCLPMKGTDSQPPGMVAASTKAEDAARRRQTLHLFSGLAQQLQPRAPTTVSPNKCTRHARDSAIVCGVTTISTTQWAARRKAKANREIEHRRELLDDTLDAFETGRFAGDRPSF
ncbi:hypothetical protein CBR_g32526 [Chara braunii]|uniref:Uncharacterized protein n=1 Tax=Chara braunii TaxID=69332 RepID=A0A388LGY6_CHABU|nr:hypothetical protein CBR_g32526 [Chara braunii]|eukprot:GBG81537.1 hypothetical protein CBR_g32526 [Chara braunii]